MKDTIDKMSLTSKVAKYTGVYKEVPLLTVKLLFSNYQMSTDRDYIETLLHTNNAKMSRKRKAECTECGQNILDKCAMCDQFIETETLDEADMCKSCGQELPEDSDDEFETQKDGTLRKICECCQRPFKTCPECKQDYDSDQDVTDDEESDDESRETASDEDGETEYDERTETEKPSESGETETCSESGE